MIRKKVNIVLWERDYNFLVEFAKAFGYGNGNKKKPGISRAITQLARNEMTSTRSFSHETKLLLMEGSKLCCKGNVEDFVNMASKEWIDNN